VSERNGARAKGSAAPKRKGFLAAADRRNAHTPGKRVSRKGPRSVAR
jgi:hypothetical protein